MPSAALLSLINDEDSTVPSAVREVLPDLARVVDLAVAAVEAGGRIHYFGAGTSGRFGVLDAAEVPPTYGVSDELVIAHMAGGDRAMSAAVEEAEDDKEAGAAEARATVRHGDIVFGLAASGRTPYVAGALEEAGRIGAHTIAVTSDPVASVAQHAEIHLCIRTGPEVVTGSTRMKAGTAQKLVLHSFSTALMVRLGRTFSNLMVDVVPTNEKLRRRVIRLLCEASGATEAAAATALSDSSGDTKAALVMLLTGRNVLKARTDLVAAKGDVRGAIERARVEDRPRIMGSSWIGLDIGASGFRMSLVEGVETHQRRDGVRPTIAGDGIDVEGILDAIASEMLSLRQGGIGGDVDAVVIGLAGSVFFPGRSAELASRMRAITGARSVSITSDIVPAYVGAIGLVPGAVLSAGTGAIAVGTDLDMLFRRVDGLGHLLGDLGSGAWIGRRALEAATAHHTGRSLMSPALEDALRVRFGDVRDLVADLYGARDRSAVLASFVPDVVAAAESGDRVATRILDEAADALTATLKAAAVGVDGPLAVVGGLALPGSFLRTRLEERMTLVHAAGPASIGAAVLAHALRSGQLPPILQSQLDTYTEGL